MEDLGTLLIRIGITGADETVSGMDRVGKAVMSAGDAAGKGSHKIGAMSLTLRDLVYSATSAAAAIGSVVAAFGALSGVRLAAKYQAVEVGLMNILHSATAAKKLMGELIQMGAQTPYDTSELVGFARQLLATGSSAKMVTRELQTLSNVGANMGLGVGDVGDLVQMLASVRTTLHAPGADTFQALSRRGINLAEVLGASGGAKFTGPMANAMAAQSFGAMPGPMAFAKIMAGLEKLNPGNVNTFASLMQNLGESIRNMMLPTGELLIKVLSPMAKFFQTVAGWIGRINQLTGGGAGLIFLLAGLVRVKVILINTALAAANAVARLNVQLAALAATGGAGVGGKGSMPGILPILGGGLRGLAGPVAAIGAYLGAEGIRKRGYSKALDSYYLGDLMANAIEGATIGGILGTRGGPGGILAGGLIGGILGIGKTMYDYGSGNEPFHNKDRDKLDQIADNTGKTADALQQMKGTLIGGGDRAGRVTGDIEAQINLARALALSKGFG